MGSEEFDDFRERVQDERSIRAQRDAAESRVPGDRLRREIREAFAREDARKLREAFAHEDARKLREDRRVGGQPNPGQPRDAKPD